MKLAKKVSILAFVFTCLMISSVVASSVYASCTSWETQATGPVWCDTSDGCGFLWLQDTAKVDAYQVRICSSGDGYFVIEERYVTLREGCC
ncbi:hypothetical protein [Bacillus horti]|uniref:Uncharacterized protein n=1 Tax=Caldalkalibacillus horti TaxID=77523 RepID=A0ABT9VVW3_9BACI|nr:hypothetical protein [Bacillus horti]MDQ0164775.1 hypothetical protein [Bacillus horti]